MQLPSAADLVRAFVADLGNVLDTGSAQERQTIQKTLWSSGSATITADRDCFIVGVKALTTLAWCLSLTNVTPAQVSSANGQIYDVIAAVSATTWVPEMISIRFLWKNGVKLYFNTGGGTGILLVLEPTL
jgi:hypothetical protein